MAREWNGRETDEKGSFDEYQNIYENNDRMLLGKLWKPRRQVDPWEGSSSVQNLSAFIPAINVALMISSDRSWWLLNGEKREPSHLQHCWVNELNELEHVDPVGKLSITVSIASRTLPNLAQQQHTMVSLVYYPLTVLQRLADVAKTLKPLFGRLVVGHRVGMK